MLCSVKVSAVLQSVKDRSGLVKVSMKTGCWEELQAQLYRLFLECKLRHALHM